MLLYIHIHTHTHTYIYIHTLIHTYIYSLLVYKLMSIDMNEIKMLSNWILQINKNSIFNIEELERMIENIHIGEFSYSPIKWGPPDIAKNITITEDIKYLTLQEKKKKIE